MCVSVGVVPIARSEESRDTPCHWPVGPATVGHGGVLGYGATEAPLSGVANALRTLAGCDSSQAAPATGKHSQKDKMRPLTHKGPTILITPAPTPSCHVARLQAEQVGDLAAVVRVGIGGGGVGGRMADGNLAGTHP